MRTQSCVVVTGASTGIGRSIALRLDRAGWHVLAGVRKTADAESLRQAAPGIEPVMLDVTQPQHLAQLRQRLEAERPNGLEALVNNAGVAFPAPLEHQPLEDIRKLMDVNLFGLLETTQQLLPLLKKARGRIVNISSISGLVSTPMLGAYSASKFAVEAATDALRLELAYCGVQVVGVLPGQIATPIWDKGMDMGTELEEQLRAKDPQALRDYQWAIDAAKKAARDGQRNGTPPEAVAEVVLRSLTVARPKPRYLVGKSAGAVRVLTLLPDRLRDKLLYRRFQ